MIHYTKTFIVLVLLVLSTLGHSYAQDEEHNPVAVAGKIINYSTKEPVDAKITYESLPYGNKIGVFSGSTFNFNMEDGYDYALMVSADGFAPYSTTLKLNDSTQTEIKKTIELVPKGVQRIIRLDKLIFALSKADISSESHEELDQLASMLEANPNMVIQLEGHTDFRGNTKQNFKLSEARVEAVREYLLSKGIEKRRIKTKAFGGTHPLTREPSESRKNRRVEVRILEN